MALGGVYCGIYPQASPGGWQLVGTTSMPMWDVERTTPAILTPGTRVKFVERDSVPSIEITPKEKSLIEPYLKVTAAALPALVQDLGRAGHAAIGVTASGALDRGSLRAANAAAGNPLELAALEISFGNFAFEIVGAAEIALAGAAVPITVTRASGEIFEATMQDAIDLHSGDRVKLGYPPRGVRTYLAVRGGFDAPKILGSASSDVLAALGPAPLVKGSLVSIGCGPVERATTVSKPAPSAPHPAPTLPKSDDVVVLDIFAGPRADWFGANALENFCTRVWQVTPRSNRVGLRLHGETPLMRQRTEELPSEGLTSGAIQVPHDGQPVLLLADHPVTGGYPVIAIVAEHHLDLAGQIPPSAKIRFRLLADP